MAALVAAAFAATPVFAYDWIQFNGDSAHRGNNTAETILAAGNVAGLVQRYPVTLPGTADSTPVFLEGVPTPAGVKDLL